MFVANGYGFLVNVKLAAFLIAFVIVFVISFFVQCSEFNASYRIELYKKKIYYSCYYYFLLSLSSSHVACLTPGHVLCL